MSRYHSESKFSKGGSSVLGPFEFNTEGHGLSKDFRLTKFGPRQDKIEVPDDLVYHFLFNSVVKTENEGSDDVNPQLELETSGSGCTKDYGTNVTISSIKNSDNMILAQAIDVIYPVVDDPYTMGKIACAEVLSNLYAIGIIDCDGIRITIGVPHQFSEKEKNIVMPYILNGFKDVAREARTEAILGNYMSNIWLTIGGIATTVCSPTKSMRYNGCVNDVLVLTKPLGTRVAINAFQWLTQRSTKWDVIKSNVSGEEIRKAYHIAIDSMSRLNKTAAMLMQKYNIRGAADVGRDGLVPSVQRLLNRQENEISFIVLNVPVIGKMQIIDRATGYTYKLTRGLCPETSGGLLVCMTREEAVDYCRDLETLEGYKAWVIGVAVKGDRTVRMSEQPMIIQVTSNMSNVNFIG